MDVTRARSEALFTPKPTEARLRVGDTVEPSGQDVKPRLFDDCSLVSQPSTFVPVGVNASSIGYPSSHAADFSDQLQSRVACRSYGDWVWV